MDHTPAKVAIVAGIAAASLGVGLGAYMFMTVHPRKARRAGHLNSAAWFHQLSAAVHLPAENEVSFASFPYYLSQKTRDILVKTAFLHLRPDLKPGEAIGGASPGYSWTKHKPTLLLTGNAARWAPEAEVYMQTLSKGVARHFHARLLLVDVRHQMAKLLHQLSSAGPTVCYIRDADVALTPHFQAMVQSLPPHIFVIASSHADSAATAPQKEVLESLFPIRLPISPPSDATLVEAFNAKVREDGQLLCGTDNRNLLLQVLSTRNVECDLGAIEFQTSPFTVGYAEEVVSWSVSHHLMSDTPPAVNEGRLQLPTECLQYGLSLSSSSSEYVYACDKKEAQTETKALQDSAGVKVGGAVRADAEGGVDAAKKVEGLMADVAAAAAADVAPAKGPAPAKVKVEDNEFEKRIRPEVLSPSAVGVTFDSIGALTHVKESLRELVMLPLQRPELFKKGGLLQPCKGILLFGPPGTGKTMLAKAVATEAGANFINISMSTITSKWFGEDEKNVRALFSLAAKIAPTVIFIDEVDSMLGRRSRVGEHEAMRKIKNEFMAHWDGLMTKASSGVLVLAATNRPFDLDEAIIRRFQRRIMVSLPDPPQRELILRSILRNEILPEDFNFTHLADLTEGHSGSDLKMKEEREKTSATTKTSATLSAALSAQKAEAEDTHTPVQPTTGGSAPTSASDVVQEEEGAEVATAAETVQVEAAVGQEKATEGGKVPSEEGEGEGEGGMAKLGLRGLTMEDLIVAKSQFAASVAMEGAGMAELTEWNELYGEGGTRKKPMLSYFL